MTKTRSILLAFLALAAATALFQPTLCAQAKWRMPFTVTDSAATLHSATVWFGVHPDATSCLDAVDSLKGFNDHWFDRFVFDQVYTPDCIETLAPPTGFTTDMQIQSVSPLSCRLAVGPNVHKYTSAAQVDTFDIIAQGEDAFVLNPLVYTTPSVIGEYADSVVIVGKVSDLDPFDNLILVNIRVNLAATGGRYTAYPTRSDDLLRTFKLFVYRPKVGPGAPATLTTIAPADGATGEELITTLSWNPAAVPGTYRVQMATDAGFTNVFFNQTTSSTSIQTAALNPNTRYYWRVSVTNQYGMSYYQNPGLSFTTKVVTPDPPVRLLPSNGQQNVSLTPLFRWKTAASATPVLSYHAQVATDAAFSTIVKDTTFNDTSFTFGTLQNCVTYYWRVQASNSAGMGSYDTTRFPFRTVLAPPTDPTLSAPANGAVGVALSPTLRWTSGDICSDNFRLQVTTDTNSGAFVLRTTTASTSLAIGPLGQNIVHFWRVKSYNALDSSAFSPWRSFRTILLPAAVPALVFPAANDTTIQSGDRFRWRSVPYADRYQFQMATDAAFTSMKDDTTLTDTSRVVIGIDNCTAYFYRVRAVNDSGSLGFSAGRSFRTRTGLPDPPTLTFPPNTKDSVDERPTFTWTGGVCSGAFQIQVSNFLDFSDTVLQATVTTLSQRFLAPLPGNTNFFWRVRSINGVGAGLYSSVFQFKTTPFTTPDFPALLFPSDGANDIPTSITLLWDSTARASTYRLQVAVDTGFTSLTVNDSTIAQQEGVLPSRSISNLINSKSYYWRVSAKNSVGSSAFSPRRSFNTLFPPTSPSIIDPINNAIDVPVTQVFSWSVPSRATQYQLEVARDLAFLDLLFSDSTLVNNSWSLPQPMKSFTKYYWRVRAKNSVGFGPFSPVAAFTTERSGVANWLIPLRIAETGPAYDIVSFGVHPYATSGIDPSLGEFELPPLQSGWFDARFVSPFLGEGVRVDYMRFQTYHQLDTFQVSFQPGIGNYPMVLSWPGSFVKNACDSMLLVDNFSSPTIRVHMEKDSSVAIASPTVQSVYIVAYGAFPVTDVAPVAERELPSGFALLQNYPNPFNPTTHVEFSTDKTAHIRVAVYDLLGREIRTLANGTYFPGFFTVEWDGTNVQGSGMPSGVYYLRMTASTLEGDSRSASVTRKMLMMK